MSQYVYVTNPIDFWPVSSLWEFVDGITPNDILKPSMIMFDFGRACRLASKAGWEGDFARVPTIFWTPNPSEGDWSYGFAWKQHNNGTCFVVSPLEIPHLKEFEHK